MDREIFDEMGQRSYSEDVSEKYGELFLNMSSFFSINFICPDILFMSKGL